MVGNIQIRMKVSTLLEVTQFLILFQAVLSLLSIQEALVFSTLTTQEILTVKNQRMEKLSVGIFCISPAGAADVQFNTSGVVYHYYAIV